MAIAAILEPRSSADELSAGGDEIKCSSVISDESCSAKKKRSAKPRPLPSPRNRAAEQHLADAPFRERGPSTASADTRAVGLRVTISWEAILRRSRVVQVVTEVHVGPRASSL